MAASLTGTLDTPLGYGTPGGHVAVAMSRRPSLSRAGDTPASGPGKHGPPLPLAEAGSGGRQAVPGTTHGVAPRRTGAGPAAKPPRALAMTLGRTS